MGYSFAQQIILNAKEKTILLMNVFKTDKTLVFILIQVIDEYFDGIKIEFPSYTKQIK
jgi:hypothetical protein